LIHVPSFPAQLLIFPIFNYQPFSSFLLIAWAISFPSVDAGVMTASYGGQPGFRAISLILLVVAFFASASLASTGDQLPEFRQCLDVRLLSRANAKRNCY
jgi:hypothetical protein